MAVLVTGAAGFIGSHVAKRLLQEGTEIVGFDNMNSAYDPRLKDFRLAELSAHEGFQFVRGDLAEQPDMGSIPWPEIETVYHLGARAGVRQSIADPHAYVRDNITGTVNVLENARRNDVESVVVASTSSLYGAHNDVPFREDDDTNRPLSPYAASKKGAEAMAATYNHLYGISTPVLRFFTVYGPAGRPDMSIFRFIRWIMAGKPVHIYGNGHQARDFTYVEDIARGVVAAGGYNGHRVFNLGSDKPYTLLEVIDKLSAIIGHEPRLEFHDAAPADVPRTWADISTARNALDWEPQIPLIEGLRRTIQWHGLQEELTERVDLGTT